MAGGFLAGAGQAIGQAATEQQNQAFELKLQSAKLETEHQNRTAEMASSETGQEKLKSAESAMSTVPGDQFKKIANYANSAAQAIRDRTPLPQIDASDITHPAGQQMLERVQGQLAHASAQMQQVSIHPVNANGHTMVAKYDKGGNQIGIEDMGLNAEGTAEVRKKEAAFGAYNSQLLSVQSKMQKWITANSAGQLPEQVASLSINKYLQSDSDAAAYFAQRPLMSLKGEIDLTHSARAVSSLGANAANAYPGMGDTVATAKAKIDNLLGIGRDGMDAEYQAWGVTPKEQHFPNLGLQNQIKAESDANAKQVASAGTDTSTPEQAASWLANRKAKK